MLWFPPHVFFCPETCNIPCKLYPRILNKHGLYIHQDHWGILTYSHLRSARLLLKGNEYSPLGENEKFILVTGRNHLKRPLLPSSSDFSNFSSSCSSKNRKFVTHTRPPLQPIPFSMLCVSISYDFNKLEVIIYFIFFMFSLEVFKSSKKRLSVLWLDSH